MGSNILFGGFSIIYFVFAGVVIACLSKSMSKGYKCLYMLKYTVHLDHYEILVFFTQCCRMVFPRLSPRTKCYLHKCTGTPHLSWGGHGGRHICHEVGMGGATFVMRWTWETPLLSWGGYGDATSVMRWAWETPLLSWGGYGDATSVMRWAWGGGGGRHLCHEVDIGDAHRQWATCYQLSDLPSACMSINLCCLSSFSLSDLWIYQGVGASRNLDWIWSHPQEDKIEFA